MSILQNLHLDVFPCPLVRRILLLSSLYQCAHQYIAVFVSLLLLVR